MSASISSKTFDFLNKLNKNNNREWFTENKNLYTESQQNVVSFQKGGYYLHMEPGKSFLAGGIYMPESSVLKEVRKEISLYGDDFLKILNNKDFKKHFPELDQDDKLKKIPQGFEKEDPMGEYLKLKNFIVVYSLKDEEVLDKNAVKNMTKVFKLMKPFNDFLNTPFL